MVAKIVNVKFRSDDEKRLHTRFKARCALEGISMQAKIINVIRAYLYDIEQ